MSPRKPFRIIAFDADDTLWEHEPLFNRAQKACHSIVEPYLSPEALQQLDHKIDHTERNNLRIFGYGIKGFMLSMIETVIELTEGKISGKEIQQLIDLGKDMLQHPLELIEGVKETVSTLADEYTLMVITKGDLFDQEGKIARSGLADYFTYVEIVSEKNEGVYRDILKRHQIDPEEFLMVGNSLRSDIIPVCQLGARAVHIPFYTTWGHEQVTEDASKPYDFEVVDKLSKLLPWLEDQRETLTTEG